MDIDLNLTKTIPYFHSLSEEDMQFLVKEISVLHLSPKEILFHEGDLADSFYIVKTGDMRITTLSTSGEVIHLARISEGGFFGEQAFAPPTSIPHRQASAIAHEATTLYKIPRAAIISLQLAHQQFQTILQKQNLNYLREKLIKLTSAIQQSAYNINELLSNNKLYPKRSVIYFQTGAANEAYILVSGEVELRSYDQEKRLKQIIDIGAGQMFGTEIFNQQNEYFFTAVAKEDSLLIVINLSQSQKVIANHPLLSQFWTDFRKQFFYKNKGKILQFRSEHMNMPSTTSIIALNDGREVICQQIIGADIFLASVTNVKSSREVKFVQSEHINRRLYLCENKLVGLVEEGIWEDSPALLDLIVNGTDLADEQISKFIQSGKIFIQPETHVSRENLVCKCMRVPYDVINRLIVSEKADFSKIVQKTGASTICGSCRPLIMEMLGEDIWVPCTISKVINHNPDVKSFQLQPTSGKIQPYKPGQYIIIKAKIKNLWIQRTYTLTSTQNLPYYEITIKKEAKGEFSPWLFSEADTNPLVYISGPFGKFTLDEKSDKPIVCFVGGIGVTPIIAFIREFMQRKISNHLYIDYSAMNKAQFIFTDEMEKLLKLYNNIVIYHRITDAYGILTEDDIKEIILKMGECHIYICGPKGLDQLVKNTLHKMKISENNIYSEQFIHSGAPDNFPQSINYE